MGRRKITIRQIVDPKLRHITFNKRKNGLIKKAAELSLLCNVNMLLIFEDGNGNLIQFSKNKLNSIPGFFQECRYNNLMEFVAKDYPNFFKVNHYKKHKERETEDYDNEDFDLGADDGSTSYDQSMPQSKSLKRGRPQGHIKEEDQDSANIIYQSASEDSDNEGMDELNIYSEPQSQPQPQLHMMPKNKSFTRAKPMISKPEEQPSKMMMNKEQVNNVPINEQEIYQQPREAFQPYKEVSARLPREEKTIEYPQQYMGFEQSFKRPVQVPDAANSQFRFYSGENQNLNMVNTNANPFANTPNYPNSHPYIHNNHAYPNVPTNYPNKQTNNRLRGFGNMNMSHMTNEETLNVMLKGLNPLGFAMGGGNPFMTKPSTKPEIDEKMLDTANMIKYLNGTGANSYATQKNIQFPFKRNGKT